MKHSSDCGYHRLPPASAELRTSPPCTCGASMKRSDITDEQVFAILDSGNGRVIDELVAQGVPVKVAYRKVQHMYRRGLVDYGTSLNHVWRRTPSTYEVAAAYIHAAALDAFQPRGEALIAGLARIQRWYDTRHGA